ncbi:LemA family protein [Candidatus Uhrbacteria bacterium]|nr:LemA family protein [Candidatus Uhrbacteria bacterium]
MSGFWIFIIVLILIGVWMVGMYNGLVRARMQVKEAWSDIDVQLKRRYDLIPNLVETVKGYAAHEKETLERVIQARNSAMQVHDKKGATPEDMAQSENMLTGALKSIFALSEAYPDLKANTNFLKLQDELSDTENKIQAARRFYNGNVRDYNTAIQTFPTNTMAGMFGFSEEKFFEIEDAKQRENVKVKF